MNAPLVVYLCLGIGLAAALVAGVFQSFSDFVMRGLIEAELGGMASMQALNRTVFRSAFIVTFLALVPATVIMAIYAGVRFEGAPRTLLIAAGVIYVLSVFLVTAAGNVPMNNRLEALALDAPEATSYWRTYGQVWTRWNHVRTVGSALTAALYLLAAVAF